MKRYMSAKVLLARGFGLIGLVAPLLVGGCATDSEPPQNIPQDGPGAPSDAPQGGTPAGSWALRRVLVVNTQQPVVGTVTNTTVLLSRVEIVAEGAGYRVTDDLCDIRLESSTQLAVPSLLPAYAKTIPDQSYSAQVVDGQWQATLPVDVRGCTLTNPSTDALPTASTDPRVIDEDGDTKPGLTVRLQVTGLGQQQVYIVQRVASALRGSSLTADKIEGAIDIPTFEQNTLGASSQVFAGNSPVAVKPNASGFTMVRVEPGTACQTVLDSDEETLFGPR